MESDDLNFHYLIHSVIFSSQLSCFVIQVHFKDLVPQGNNVL